MLASTTNLLEIDMLRAGTHTLAVPLSTIGDAAGDYTVSLHRGGQWNRFEVWPVRLRGPLPCVRVPLAEGEQDVVLDLQAVLDRCYDEGAYARQIDYSAEPEPPLSVEDAAWADALLREKGLR